MGTEVTELDVDSILCTELGCYDICTKRAIRLCRLCLEGSAKDAARQAQPHLHVMPGLLLPCKCLIVTWSEARVMSFVSQENDEPVPTTLAHSHMFCGLEPSKGMEALRKERVWGALLDPALQPLSGP
jgi:hypothetical protein